MNERENSTGPSAAPSSVSRRRILRGGLTVAPVVMSVASKPVLGSTVCQFASAAALSAGSNAMAKAQTCNGLRPDQWKMLAAQWPQPYCGTSAGDPQEQATLYHCPATGFSGRIFGELTMLEVLDVGEGGPGLRGLGRYMVAALLNACCGRTPVLNETTVRSMWNDMLNVGYYEPTAGVQWQAPEIIAYLNTTMG